MPINKLTDSICRKATATDKPRKLSDGHGLYLWVSPTGAKVWRVGYRQFGKEGIEVLGPYPLLSLADARIRRDAFRMKLLDGVDAKAKPEKVKPSITFSEASSTYWQGRNNISDGYRLNATRGIAMHLEPSIGLTPIASVTKDLLLAPLVRLDNAGKHVYARRVPKGRMKMKRVHLVPLSRQAQALLAELKARSRGGEYVFPSDRRIDRPMSENAVLYLLHRIGYKGRLTGHGFRGIASTWANEHGYPSDHIEMQLAHGHGDAVRNAYNHAKYLPQRRVMLQDFSDWWDGQSGSNQINPSRPQG